MFALEQILQNDPNAKAIRKGAQDFIAKPFLPEQLQETIHSCLCEMVAG